MKQLGTICKQYRKHNLKMTLAEFSRLVKINYQTLYSFENNRSSNVKMFKAYYKVGTEEDKKYIAEKLWEIL